MIQARNNVRETAAFARRVVCRTLTVVGGVAAGTAIAWWLSTASASADVQHPVEDQARAAVTPAQDFAEPVTNPVERAVETVTQYLQDPPPPPKDPLKDLGEKVKDAAGKFRDQAEHKLEELPGAAQHDHGADLGYGRSDVPAAVTPITITPPPVAPAVAVDAIAHGTAKERAIADGMSRRGSPVVVAPSLPALPDWPTQPLFPPAPAGVPAAGAHGSSGNPVDSHLFAALPWQSNAFDLVAGGVTAAADAATFGRPGTQPGVAPD